MEEIVGSTNLNDSPESTPSVQVTESVKDFTPTEIAPVAAVAESVVEKTLAEETPTALPVELVVETTHEVIESKIETPTVELQAESVDENTQDNNATDASLSESVNENVPEETAPTALPAESVDDFSSVEVTPVEEVAEPGIMFYSEEMPLKQSITDSPKTVYQSCIAGAVGIFFLMR